jgi:hypothetical protein
VFSGTTQTEKYHSFDYNKLKPLKKGLKNKVEYKSLSPETFLKYIFHL